MQEQNNEKLQNGKNSESSQEARDKAVALAASILSYKSRSAQALYDRLLEKGSEPKDASYAVARMIELGFLDDKAYARDVVEGCKARGWGRIRAAQELRKRKIDPELAEEVLEGFEPDYDKIDSLVESRLRGDVNPDQASLRRVRDCLLRRGFTWEQARSAIERYKRKMEDEL